MSQQELLTAVITTLHDLGIEFMLTGSHASSLQGESRATHDIDLVADLAADHVPLLMQAFSADRYYVSEPAIRDAILTKRMFNLLETTTGEKVDFWILTDSGFDQSRFNRRQTIDLGELTVDVSTPEDTILMKLLWCKQTGGSEKHFNDVLRVYELQADLLNIEYMQNWLAKLEVTDLWQRVVDEAEPFQPLEPN